MYLLQAEASFDAAHFLKGYNGKCKNLHGHRWRVVARIQGCKLQEDGSQRGMLVDFGELKNDLKSLADEMDHALLVEHGSLRPETLAALEAEEFRMVMLPFRTTAENLARYLFEQMTAIGYAMLEVEVYETPSNCAVYRGEEAPYIVQL